jgi:hypothetical protein
MFKIMQVRSSVPWFNPYNDETNSNYILQDESGLLLIFGLCLADYSSTFLPEHCERIKKIDIH